MATPFPTTDDLTFLSLDTATNVLNTLRWLVDVAGYRVFPAVEPDDCNWYVFTPASGQKQTLAAWATNLLHEAGQLRGGGAA